MALDQAENELGVTKWGNQITIHIWNPQTMQITDFFCINFGATSFLILKIMSNVIQVQCQLISMFVDKSLLFLVGIEIFQFFFLLIAMATAFLLSWQLKIKKTGFNFIENSIVKIKGLYILPFDKKHFLRKLVHWTINSH